MNTVAPLLLLFFVACCVALSLSLAEGERELYRRSSTK